MIKPKLIDMICVTIKIVGDNNDPSKADKICVAYKGNEWTING